MRNASVFSRDSRGAVALMMALVAVPLFVAIGLAVDLSRAHLVRARLGQSLDAAGLAVGASIGLSEQEMMQVAQSYFDANYPDDEIGVPTPLSLSIDGARITLSATADLPTVIMGVVGIDTMTVGTAAEVTRESRGLEVALVLDNTGSMRNNGKIDTLIQAATDLTDILFGDDAVNDALKIGLVPFSAGVNVGPNLRYSGFMDLAGGSAIHSENFENNTGNRWTLYDSLPSYSWNGCVETRAGPYDELDTAPDPANPDTLWVPWFAPDEPDLTIGSRWRARSYPNTYLGDQMNGDSNYAERQESLDKYENPVVLDPFGGPAEGCDVAPITPLVDDRDEVLDAIGNMVATGFTHIPVGLAWGWRVLSPGEPFTEGVAYDEPGITKALILLTDGENTIPDENNHNYSQYTAYGYLAKQRLGTNWALTAEQRLDEKTATLCENIKEEGVRLYTITFQVSGEDIRNLMRECATDPTLYYDSPSNAELRDIFRTIAQDLGNLRISR